MSNGEFKLDFNVGKYKSIFNAIPTPTYIWKIEDNIITLDDYNKAAEIITEGKISDYLGLNLIELYPPGTEVHNDIKKAFYDELSFSKELLYNFQSTGKQKFLKVTYSFIPPNFVLVYTEDITKQKAAEKLLKKAERDKSIILDSISEHIVYQDIDGKILWLNNAAADSVGVEIEQLIGKKCFQIWMGRDERCFGCPVELSIQTGKPILKEMKSPDGRSWLVRGFPVLDKKGDAVAAVEITSELTKMRKAEEELKASELQYRNTINSMGDAIHVIDKNLRIILYNPSLERWLKKIGLETDILNKKLSEVFTFLSRQVLSEYKLVFETGNPLVTDEETTVKGKKYFTESRKIPITKEGKIIQIITIIRDISERKNSEQKLKESEIKYREAFNRSNFYKDLFAHDINNIFQNIQSSTELLSLLLDDIKVSKGDNFIDIIKDQIIRGTKLVSNVTKLSELDESESLLKKIELFEILNDTKNYIIKSFHNKNINIQIKAEKEKLYLSANELLTDIFENILINAVRYNQNEFIDIIIDVSTISQKNKNFIQLEFIDNGIGIPDEMKEKVFQRGYNQKNFIKGLGLGLTLVKKIVEIYGGKIWVEDNIKGDHAKGSKFMILLPEVV